MVAMSKLNSFPRQLFEGNHDFAVAADTLEILLTSAAPTATDNGTADVTEIATGNGYAATNKTIGPSVATITAANWEVAVTPTTTAYTATGGSMASFRYVVVYNADTATTAGDLYDSALVGYWDYGQAVTLASGNSFTINWTNNRVLSMS